MKETGREKESDGEVYLGGECGSPPSLAGLPWAWRPRCCRHGQLHARATQAGPEWRAGLQSRAETAAWRGVGGMVSQQMKEMWNTRQQRKNVPKEKEDEDRWWAEWIKEEDEEHVSERKRKKMENKMAARGYNHLKCTCARSIISGVYFDGVRGEGAPLRRVSVGRTIHAAVTHSVQVAAICPETSS